MATTAVTDDTFESEVMKADLPVVVDFWAEWCGPCKQIGPALEELSDEMNGKVKIVKVDVDNNPNTPAQLGVRGIPALFIFKDGQVVANRAGAAPKSPLPPKSPLQNIRECRAPGRVPRNCRPAGSRLPR